MLTHINFHRMKEKTAWKISYVSKKLIHGFKTK